MTEVVASGRSSKDVVRHVGSGMDNTVGCGPFKMTDKLPTTMALIRELAFPYAVAVCGSALREPDARHAVNRFGAAGGGLPAAQQSRP